MSCKQPAGAGVRVSDRLRNQVGHLLFGQRTAWLANACQRRTLGKWVAYGSASHAFLNGSNGSRRVDDDARLIQVPSGINRWAGPQV